MQIRGRQDLRLSGIQDAHMSLNRDKSLDRTTLLRQLATAVTIGIGGRSMRGTPANAIGSLFEFKDQARFAQHITVQVPDMVAALKFYVDGVGMNVLRTRGNSQFNTTVVGFGPEVLDVPPDFVAGISSFRSYGGHFTLELNSEKGTTGEGMADEDIFYDPGNGLQFIQIAPENYRISKIAAAGGIIESGYGFLQVLAPGGLRLKILSGERRDPPMFMALKVKDLKKSTVWYTEVAGMKQMPFPKARAPGSSFEPEQPKGSVFMAYEGEAFGVVLIPASRGESINPGSVASLVVLVEDVDGIAEHLGTPVIAESQARIQPAFTAASDPDGYVLRFMDYSGWRQNLPP